ncbi:hypothetical protein J3E74DRAFT_354510 [Bipolaris maydis]|nr:hypothetical protein J3E74DRAFT_354510 [Bipolaris maydis]
MKLSTLLFLVPLASARVIRQAHQVPIVDKATGDTASVEDKTTHASPTIGLHFTTSHAVAAAHYQNGTTRDLVRMQGDADYQDLMRRWMSSGSGYTGPLEPSDEMVLSGFMIRLHRAIETELDDSAPRLQRKFQKAMVAAGLASSDDSAVLYEEAMATHAALKPASSCTTQSKSEHLQHVLFLAFDDGAFSASMHEYTCRDYASQGHIINRSIRSDLGWWHLPMYDAPRAKFWSQVKQSIALILSPQGKAPGRIVLLGSHGADAEFKSRVEEALWDELEMDVSGMLSVNERGDSEWLAARGAAELASRHGEKKYAA